MELLKNLDDNQYTEAIEAIVTDYNLNYDNQDDMEVLHGMILNGLVNEYFYNQLEV